MTHMKAARVAASDDMMRLWQQAIVLCPHGCFEGGTFKTRVVIVVPDTHQRPLQIEYASERDVVMRGSAYLVDGHFKDAAASAIEEFLTKTNDLDGKPIVRVSIKHFGTPGKPSWSEYVVEGKIDLSKFENDPE